MHEPESDGVEVFRVTILEKIDMSLRHYTKNTSEEGNEVYSACINTGAQKSFIGKKAWAY